MGIDTPNNNKIRLHQPDQLLITSRNQNVTGKIDKSVKIFVNFLSVKDERICSLSYGLSCFFAESI